MTARNRDSITGVWRCEAVDAEHARATPGQVKRGGAPHRSQTDHATSKSVAHVSCTFLTHTVRAGTRPRALSA